MTDPQEPAPYSTDRTGSAGAEFKLLERRFGPYTITLRLTATNQFVEIVEIRAERDFRSTKERIQNRGFHDVSDLYEGKET